LELRLSRVEVCSSLLLWRLLLARTSLASSRELQNFRIIEGRLLV
jgi:hypothetical protein